VSDPVDQRLVELCAEHQLPAATAIGLRSLLTAVAAAPLSLTSVRDPARAVEVHVADSLSALAVPELRAARRIADLGSGGGFPGVPLALALPNAKVTLVESVTRKARFLTRVTADLGLVNTTVLPERVEAWAAGRATQDVVCARALAPLNVLVEYAAPLLRVGGILVAWKGRVGDQEQAAGDAAAPLVGMARRAVVRSSVSRDMSDARTLYVYESLSLAPNEYPRRPGMGRKRPLCS